MLTAILGTGFALLPAVAQAANGETYTRPDYDYNGKNITCAAAEYCTMQS
jgi:hypothetical protein